MTSEVSANAFNSYCTVSVAAVLSTAIPPSSVVAVVVYVPAHAFFGTINGNETVFDVPAANVNCGVVNITVLVLLQEGPSGPVNVNFSLMVWAAGLQDITVPVTVIVPPRPTFDGVIASAT